MNPIGYNKKTEMIGNQYGLWTVLEDLPRRGKTRYVLCRCACGIEKPIPAGNLLHGKTSSCITCMGKRGARHGAWKKPEYAVWQAMLARCRCTTHNMWPNYGGRGITVCKEWEDFEVFIRDMGWRPSAKHTIERNDNEKGYCPENCRWATTQEQQRNKRTNRYLEYQGERLTYTDWAARLGCDPKTIFHRIESGWSIERTLTEPPGPAKTPTLLTYQGETLSLPEWARRRGLNRRTLAQRLDLGWSVERALTEKTPSR